MNWGSALVRELAEERCIIFLGAGASATSSGAGGVRPPSWKALLESALTHFNAEKKIQDLVKKLIKEGAYLNAAEIIFGKVNMPDAKDFFKEKFLTPRYSPSRLHEVVRELNAKIVIQTNYDSIYEKCCGPIDGENGFVVKRYYDEGILDEVRSHSRLIIKAHGCIKEPEKLILTRSQYFKIKSRNPDFYRLLDGLFLTHTVLFIGCSLTDPDMQLVLENTNLAVNCNHPHYALMPSGEHMSIVESTKLAYNIQYIEYDNKAGDYKKFIPSLEDLKDQVIALRATLPK